MVILVIVSTLVSVCGSNNPSGLRVDDVRLGEPTGPNAALYLTVTSDRPDRLIGATTAVADSVELHETIMESNGTVSMRPVTGFAVGEDRALVLAPGGKHLMFVEVERLEVGDTVEVKLDFEKAEDVVVVARVVAPQAVGR